MMKFNVDGKGFFEMVARRSKGGSGVLSGKK
jgi:hypothetical protein